jgi:polar amino acid transport system substrate-binding protein
MRKWNLLWIVALAGLILSACGGAATPAATQAPASSGGGMPDLGGKTITVAVENAYPPFNNIDPNTNQPVGWDYDTVAEICKRINCVPEFKQAAWDGIFPAMQAGEYDMLADGVTVTDERKQMVDFSEPYVTIGQVLLIPADKTIDDPSAFEADTSVSVGTQIGTTNEIVAKQYFGDRVKSFEDFGGAVAALLSGDVDAVVIDTVSAVGFINENPGKLKVGPTLTSDEQLAFVFPPGSDLTASVNAALDSMTADGTLKQLNDKWFNP